jgi:hypothetical protein
MEITNDNYFNVKYNTKLDRLEVRKKNKFLEKVQKHKVISVLGILLIMFSCLNFFLIYSFMRIIETI